MPTYLKLKSAFSQYYENKRDRQILLYPHLLFSPHQHLQIIHPTFLSQKIFTKRIDIDRVKNNAIVAYLVQQVFIHHPAIVQTPPALLPAIPKALTLLFTLDHLEEKGAILGPKIYEKDGKEKCYSKAPFAIGMYELQAGGSLTKEFEKDAMEYMEKKFIYT